MLLTRIASSHNTFNSFIENINQDEFDRFVFNIWLKKQYTNNLLNSLIKDYKLFTKKQIENTIRDLSIEYIKTYLFNHPVDVDINDIETTFNTIFEVPANELLRNFITNQHLFADAVTNYLSCRSSLPNMIYQDLRGNMQRYINNCLQNMISYA